MTLYRQIVLVIIVLSVSMFAGTVVVNVNNARDYLAAQLESHAQDTATSLGLSISPHMANNDEPMMTSMVDAIFDRGYYEDIILKRINGEVLWSRHQDVTIEDVPSVLIGWIKLDAPQASSIIMSGWGQAGEVYVKSHPGYAYQTLWGSIKKMLWWFSMITVGLLLLAGIAVRMLLRPLERLEGQALAVSERRFDEISDLPRTRELRNVIKAMNKMTGKVKQMFEEQSASAEEMRSLAFQDPLTGAHNRRYFSAALGNSLGNNEEASVGAMLLVQVHDLQGVNQRMGFEAGDAMIKAAADIMRDCFEGIEGVVLARLSGGDFAIMAEGISEQRASQLADELCRRLVCLHGDGLLDTEEVCHIGMVMYKQGMSYGDVMSMADTGLQTATTQGVNTWAIYSAPEQDMSMPGRQDWQNIVRSAVASGEVVLHAQPVARVDDRNVLLHREILLRLPGSGDVLWTAGMFFPVAEHIGLASDLDKIVIANVMGDSAMAGQGTPLAINISSASLHDGSFMNWLDSVLATTALPGNSVTFELSESTVAREFEHVSHLAEVIRQRGFGFAVDHFGRGMTAFGYLQSLRPDYVKIDGLYMTNIADNQDDRFFVGSLCKVAHSLDIIVIAEAVENENQLSVLGELGVDGVQGFGIGRPGAL